LAEHGAHVVVTGGIDDTDLVAGVVGRMRRPATPLASRLNLGGLLGLYSRCRLVVSNDTGPLHLANAVGTATVGIYWCPNFVSAAPATRAHFRPLVAWTLRCPRCQAPFGQGEHNVEPWRATCDHPVSWVSEVTVNQVKAAALELWHLTDCETGHKSRQGAPAKVR
jgi:ADP-heptose:LPS heptosyltransferase